MYTFSQIIRSAALLYLGSSRMSYTTANTHLGWGAVLLCAAGFHPESNGRLS